MGDPHGGVGRVDALAARSARPEHVDLQVLVVDLDVDLVGLGQHEDRRRGRVDPALALGDRHPLHPVRPALVLEARPRALAPHEEGDLVEPAEVARVDRQRLDLQPVASGVRLVHLVEVAGEQVGLLAALGAPDLDDHVAPGVRIGGTSSARSSSSTASRRRSTTRQLGLEVGRSSSVAIASNSAAACRSARIVRRRRAASTRGPSWW